MKLLADAANDSSSPEVYDLLGDAYSQSKEYAKAEDAYRKAVEEDPDDPGHLHGLAQALMAQDKYAEALEQFKTTGRSGTWHRRKLFADGAAVPPLGEIRSGGIESYCVQSSWRPAAWKSFTTKRCYMRIKAATTTR